MLIRAFLHALSGALAVAIAGPLARANMPRLWPDSRARNRRRLTMRAERAQLRRARPAGTKIARMAAAGRIGKAHP